MDLSLKAWIWASQLGFWPQGLDLSLKGSGRTEKKEEKEEKVEEKFVLCESIDIA